MEALMRDRLGSIYKEKSVNYNAFRMPRIKSAKKALRQSVTRKARNVAKDNALKSLVKKYRKTTEAGKTAEAVEMLPQVYKALDKAAKTKLIKRNKANRLKGRLTKAITKKTA